MELGAPEDLQTQLLATQARAWSRRPEETLKRLSVTPGAAIEMAVRTNSPVLLGDAYYDMGEAMALLGKGDVAVEAFRDALAQYEAKESVVMAERTRGRLAEFGG